MENLLPSFWKDSISRIFADAGIAQSVSPASGSNSNRLALAAPRRGSRTPVDSKRQRAKDLKAAGYSYGEVGKMLGVSKSYAYKLAKE